MLSECDSREAAPQHRDKQSRQCAAVQRLQFINLAGTTSHIPDYDQVSCPIVKKSLTDLLHMN